jgi:hypothetical protein
MPTTSITSFLAHLRVLLCHDVPTTSRKPSPIVQLWQDYWCPNSAKTQTPEISSLSGEGKEQEGMPIKAQRIHIKEDGKKIMKGTEHRGEKMREGEREPKGAERQEKKKQRGRNRRQKENPSNEHPHDSPRKTPATNSGNR